MSVDDARRYARRARKLAPQTMYDFARSFEKAIEEMANEIEALKNELAKSGGGTSSNPETTRPSRWS